eukprot:Blabericola_migrator_1__4865@NODE_2547_length_2623_cov_19_105634_g1593_i0_p1_GENE_NODE_2547_length_2623_cov_19_105634_g1593_i0NODE_2547_length_2623_cov_19_105634_g1593_i0_p1_ORF_typecomplete_len225_score29_71CAP/PF00188_26/7_5e05_NODE_2547_length_2623_cov_19_105634_g1593_i017322406
MRSFAVVALGALMGAHGVELISVPKILPDTMPSREGEPIRYDLPHEFLNLQGPAPRQRKVSDYIIGDLQEAGTVVTDDSETGYMWRRLILEKFNAIRKNDGYEANYMTKLRWDFHLEAYAEQWAKYSCQNSEPNYVQKTRPDWPWGYATGELNGGGCEKYTSLPPFVQSMTDVRCGGRDATYTPYREQLKTNGCLNGTMMLWVHCLQSTGNKYPDKTLNMWDAH